MPARQHQSVVIGHRQVQISRRVKKGRVLLHLRIGAPRIGIGAQ